MISNNDGDNFVIDVWCDVSVFALTHKTDGIPKHTPFNNNYIALFTQLYRRFQYIQTWKSPSKYIYDKFHTIFFFF